MIYIAFSKLYFMKNVISRILVVCIIMFLSLVLTAQNYTSYFTGNTTNIVTNPSGGVCLMGGASEDDNAMKWFLQRANGGDVLVLRATGTNGYNNYLYSTLGIPVNSVETIVFHNQAASFEPYIHQKIQQAEAIWIAGGDQWNYISYWRNSPIDSLINLAINQRNVVIGGTSAGMAIQGKYYFSAQIGTVNSATALANPFHPNITVDSTSFIRNNFLQNVITDTHFDNPDRKGRLTSFLARIYTDYGVFAKAIACDEYTAVCIDNNGIAKVFGGFPSYDDNAYFIQTNCELPFQAPEVCVANTPLTWNLSSQALKVYRIKGNSTANNSFDLTNWQNASGGQWFNWSVNNGVFSEQIGNPINCNLVSIYNSAENQFVAFPNPTADKLYLKKLENYFTDCNVEVYNSLGIKIVVPVLQTSTELVELDFSALPAGFYFIKMYSDKNALSFYKILKN